MDEKVATPHRHDSAAAGRGRRHLLERLLPGIGRHRGREPTVAIERFNALPEALLESAVVSGFEGVRMWGDVYTQAFEDSLIKKNKAIRKAAEAGINPSSLHKADFLALSGGGDKGAFSAGVLSGWSERGDRPTFEVVTGVSAGALAAPFAFLGKAHDTCLRDIYTEYGAAHLYRSRGLRGFFSDALNDTTRLDALIRSYVTEDFLDLIAEEHGKGRRLLVLTTNLDAQRQVIWALSAIAASGNPGRRDLFVKVLRASSALPGVFPPVRIDVRAGGRTYDELHVDGGVTAELVFIPPESQILHIEDMVFPERRERTLWVIENGKLGPEYAAIDLNILPLALRAVQTMVKYQVIDNLLALALITRNNKGKFFFNAIPPSFNPKPHSLFDRGYARELFEVGRQVGLSGKWFASPPSSPTLLPMEAFEEEHGAMEEAPRSFGYRGCMQSAAAAGYQGAVIEPPTAVTPE
jgi:Patatin-like phospholipase